MKLKEKIKSAGFWSGLIGTLFLVLASFGVDVGDETVSAIVNSVCSLLVVFGIISSPAEPRDDAQAVSGTDSEADAENKSNEDAEKEI